MCGIFNIPDEVLDRCLEELLPPLPGEERFDTAEPLPVPVDLLSCRLVCRSLERLASPWAWRRAQIGHDSTSEICPGAWRRALIGTGVERGDSSSKFFSARPGLARHVRLLRIAHFRCTFGSPDPISHPMTFDMRPALRLMDNLRTIVLHHIRHAGLVTELLRKPHLHTAEIIFCNIPTPMDMEPCVNLKRLMVQLRLKGVEDVLQIAPLLESLHLQEGPDSLQYAFNPTTFSIPWETLREIGLSTFEIHGATLLRGILENFTTWKARSSIKLSPLIEVNIHHKCGILDEDFSFILSALKGQPLEKLRLSNVKDQDQALLRRIVDAFPRLTKLGLVTSNYVPWPNDLPQITSILEGLRLLEMMEWNHGELPWALPEVSLPRARQLVQAFAQRCPRLTRVKFAPCGWGGSRSALTFCILRNDLGQYENCEFHMCPDWQSLHTSAWHPDNHHFL